MSRAISDFRSPVRAARDQIAREALGEPDPERARGLLRALDLIDDALDERPLLTPEVRAQIAAAVRSRREAEGLTQHQLARRLHLDPKTLATVERAQRAPHRTTLRTLARHLGWDLHWLLQGEVRPIGTDPVPVPDRVAELRRLAELRRGEA